MASRAFGLVLKALGTKKYPNVLKWFWQKLYNLMSRFWSNDDWSFLNYGYLPEVQSEQFVLDEEDEPYRPFLGLYFQAVDGLNISGKRVLEIGCGRGGGIAYIAKYYSPESVIGLDYSKETIKKAESYYPSTDVLSYQWGDAENLPYPDNHFDYVINIESSHCYPNMEKFVQEAARVLKGEGILTWADIRGKGDLNATDKHFASEADLSLEYENSLSKGVLRALDAMNEMKMQRIKRIPLIRKFFAEFAGMKDSKIYNWLESGNVVYIARRYQKNN